MVKKAKPWQQTSCYIKDFKYQFLIVCEKGIDAVPIVIFSRKLTTNGVIIPGTTEGRTTEIFTRRWYQNQKNLT